ncbi:MAG: antibiotic biosynthesis monooxygenase [Candidatus Dormibacteria bacterium]
MYGTIMRARVKPDRRQGFESFMSEMTPGADTGFIGVQVGWEDTDSNRVVLVVVFKDKESYVRNADDPHTDEMYRKQLEFLEGEPEWIDVNWAQYFGGASGQGPTAGA